MMPEPIAELRRLGGNLATAADLGDALEMARTISTWLTAREARAVYQGEPIVIDPVRHTATYGEQTLRFRPSEFAVMLFLARRSGQLISRDRLWTALYGHRRDGGPDPKTIDVFLCFLRKKLPNGVIETVREVGIVWRAPVEIL